MIIREVLVTPEFKQDFERLDTSLQKKVKHILQSIEYGTKIHGVFHLPLHGDLRGFTSVHFNKNSHRLIYRVMNNKIKVLILTVGTRGDGGDIYNKLREINRE
ncbi:MAG: mRNA-degrading endonuclease RelE of RelBE toxin-antitoxin system [Patescibacteria group bacterium]|jgi:mRNA-degrading endonuclease RelE of RelBE toxin-antitoxin system